MNVTQKKAYRRYTGTKQAWDENLDIIKDDPSALQEISDYLSKNRTIGFFRIHVSGDFINDKYFREWCKVCNKNQHVKFLAFTKAFNVVNDNVQDIPENMKIVFSAWPDMPMENPNNFPVAWLKDGKEDRIPETAVKCSGHCSECAGCWFMNFGDNVYFEKH